MSEGEGLMSKSTPEAGTKGGKIKRGQRHQEKIDKPFDISCYAGSGSKKTSTSNTEQAAEEHVVLEDESMFPSLSRTAEIGAYKTKLCQFWQRNETCPNGDECRFAHGEQELRGLRPVPSSDSDKNTQESQNDASLSESHNDASPAKSQSDASPLKSQNDASPSMSQNDASLAKSQNDVSPSKSQNDASPSESQNVASPSKFAHGAQELRELHAVPSPDLDRNMQELQMSKSETPAPSAGPVPTLMLNNASPAKSQINASPAMSQNDASPSMSQNDASPSMSQNDASPSKFALVFGSFPVSRPGGDKNVCNKSTRGEQESRPVPSQVRDSNIQISKSNSSPLSSALSTPCSVLSRETMETPSPSARPAPTSKLNYASPAKSQINASPAKPQIYASPSTATVLPEPSYSDWNPLDDGIGVTLPSGAPPTREAVDEHIGKVLYGPTRRKRLSAFTDFCPE